MNKNIPLHLHLRVRLGMATERERVEYLNARWHGKNPSTLGALTVRGMKSLVPVGLAAAAILITLGAASPKREPAPASVRESSRVSVVHNYHLDVRIGDQQFTDDWHDGEGANPEDAMAQRLDKLAKHWTSK